MELAVGGTPRWNVSFWQSLSRPLPCISRNSYTVWCDVVVCVMVATLEDSRMRCLELKINSILTMNICFYNLYQFIQYYQILSNRQYLSCQLWKQHSIHMVPFFLCLESDDNFRVFSLKKIKLRIISFLFRVLTYFRNI